MELEFNFVCGSCVFLKVDKDIKGFKSESYHGDPFGAHAPVHRLTNEKKERTHKKNKLSLV